MRKTLPLFFMMFVPAALVAVGQVQNPRHVWIDDVTNTNCGHCPCMDSILMQHVLVQHPNTSIIQIHGPMSNYETPAVTGLSDSLHFQMSGLVLINRQNIYANQDQAVDSVNLVFNDSPEAPVKLEILTKTFNTGTGDLFVSVKATSLSTNLDGLFRINLMVTEGNLIGWQQHFPECPGGPDYNHQNVLRAIACGFTGDTLINGPWADQQPVIRDISLILNNAWVPENCNLLVYVDKKTGSLHTSPVQQSIIQNVLAPLSNEPQGNSQVEILNIYPNPVHGVANIHYRISQRGNVSILLQTTDGRNVKERNFPDLAPGIYNLEFDAAELPAGNYILTILTGRTTHSRNIQIL